MGTNGKVRLLIIGLGNMGGGHVANSVGSSVVELAAVCDLKKDMLDRARVIAKNPALPVYIDYREAMDAAKPDAVLIAVPHYFHPEIALAAFSRGIHVLVEKPVAVHALDARLMTAAWETARAKKSDLVYAAMFQQRTLGHWRKIKQLLDEGELGKLVRTTWIITDWFRSQAYYDSGDWRATWSGEGGGVLLNQCPHNLDLYRWFVGLPKRVHGFCSIGKYHDIEVEDEVTAHLEHDNGMVGHFITSTGEAPGTNRLEIVGENGVLVYENGDLTYRRNRKSMLVHLRETREGFTGPECWSIKIPFQASTESGHLLIIEDFARAILEKRDPMTPASEGVESVSLGNAMLYSSLIGSPVELPMDEEAYAAKLAELAATSRYESRKGKNR